MRDTVKIEALFTTDEAPDDVLAYALSLQHSRHAILSHRVDRVGGMVSVRFDYPTGLDAEVEDVADRLRRGRIPVDVMVRR